ncbi:MAG: hypothetical protein ACOCQD_00150 [archaeon]
MKGKSGKNAKPDIFEEISEEEVDGQLQEIAEKYGIEFEEAKKRFTKAVMSSYANNWMKSAEAKKDYGLTKVQKYAKSSQSIPAKPTMTINCILRRLSPMVINNNNVTEETRDMNRSEQVGIAGSWLVCEDCGRKFDSEQTGEAKCPNCSSSSTYVMPKQKAPKGTIGVVNRKTGNTGDISVFNTQNASIFIKDEEGNYDTGVLKFQGKQIELLNKIKCGDAFSINVDETNVYESDNGDFWYQTTGTSDISNPTEEMDDIITVYQTLYDEFGDAIIQDIHQLEDRDYATLLVDIAGDIQEGNSTWIVPLSQISDEEEDEESEDEDEEPEILTLYLRSEAIANKIQKLVDQGIDVGILECMYTERKVTVEGEEQIRRTVNIVEDSVCGIPFYFMGEDGTVTLDV